MPSSLYIMISIGMTLATIILQFSGIIIHGFHTRNIPWYLMLSGGFTSALGPFAVKLLHIHPVNSSDVLILTAPYAIGSILFFSGFAINALGMRRQKERLIELEAVAAAQATELERLRNS